MSSLAYWMKRAEKLKQERDEMLDRMSEIAECYENGSDSVGDRINQAYDMRCLARAAIDAARKEK